MKLKHIIILALTILVIMVIAFVLTTSLSKPEKFKLVVPKGVGDSSKKHSPDSTLTILLLENGKVVCYQYKLNDQQLSLTQLRGTLIKVKETIKDFTVIIKSTNKNDYKLMVDILDEMQINGIKKYAIVEANDNEKYFAKKITNKNN